MIKQVIRVKTMLITSAFIEKIKNAYDIRSHKIEENDAYIIGKSFGSYLKLQNKNKVIVGYDRRSKSLALHNSLAKGLIETGINVVSIGKSTTAMVEIAEFFYSADASISVTASHNGASYHGFKFFVDKKSFAGHDLAGSLEIAISGKFASGKKKGNLSFQTNFALDYSDILKNSIKNKGKFKIGWDLCNASAGDVFNHVLKFINGINIIINHEEKEDFGGFAPDPSINERLKTLKASIKKYNLDFAFAFDGDSDRCILIDKKGNRVPGDKLLAMFSYFAIKKNKKNITTVWDSKSSQVLIKWLSTFGVKSIISPTGHSNIYNNLKKANAEIGGEFSGHYMFKDFFGVNDGIYSALRFVQHLEENNMQLEEAINLMPKVWVDPEKNIECSDIEKVKTLHNIEKVLKREGVTIQNNDGIKACYSYGWWLVRASKTEPILRISAEGWTEEGLERTKNHLSVVLESIGIDY